MAIYTFEQRKNIIVNNPNKGLIDYARKQRKRYMLHVHGVGIDKATTRIDYCENERVFEVRKKLIISNKDLCKRLLNNENQVFTATGGSQSFNLPEAQEKQMTGIVNNVIYGMPLNKWVETFALEAYRCDPMSVIFMEADEVVEVGGEQYAMPKCYPTYKSSGCIYDYLPNGRNLEYICFELTEQECKDYGITTANVSTALPENLAAYVYNNNNKFYRFIDDSEDAIYMLEGNNITAVEMRQANPMPNTFGKVPAFIVSDLMQFDNPQAFGSPLQFVIELLESFMSDRGVRELIKKLHSFPKAVEPQMQCQTCVGEGFVAGKPCPDCSVPGADKGTGYKLHTMPSDVAKFPLELLKEANLDIHKIFGYIQLPVESLDKMDLSLSDLEQVITHTYWGTHTAEVTGFNGRQAVEQTATKTLTDLQPQYARMNMTADWKDQTVTFIANFIGQYWFNEAWKGANISSGRNYILESAQILMDAYHEMRTKGTPDVMLDDQFKRYIRALYQNNPRMQAMTLKFFDVEPFPHSTPELVDASMTIPLEDKLTKRYYGEWVNSLTDPQRLIMKREQLLESLKAYVVDKTAAIKQQMQQEAALANKGALN